MATLHEVIVRHGPAYGARYGGAMPAFHARAIWRLSGCRTGEVGHVFHQCGTCQGWQVMPAPCGHRACAQCGHDKAQQWQEAQSARLLPGVPYAMVTATVPSQFRKLFKSNQKLCYDLFFKEAAGTVQEIARDQRHLGGEVGMTGVLHTWKRDLGYHPHVHLIMPAGAWDGEQWVEPRRAEYWLPVLVLAVRLRNRMRETLRRDHPDLARQLPAGAWKQPWNVHIQMAGKGERALRYLARYVQSTAIRDRRIVACDEKTVTYKWVDRQTQKERQVKVAGPVFMSRFMQHVLPPGLVRVRHFGFLAAAAKKTYFLVREAVPRRPEAAQAGATTQTAKAKEKAQAAAAPCTKPCCRKCRTPMTLSEYVSPHSSGPKKLRLRRKAQQEPLSREEHKAQREGVFTAAAPPPVRGPPAWGDPDQPRPHQPSPSAEHP